MVEAIERPALTAHIEAPLPKMGDDHVLARDLRRDDFSFWAMYS